MNINKYIFSRVTKDKVGDYNINAPSFIKGNKTGVEALKPPGEFN